MASSAEKRTFTSDQDGLKIYFYDWGKPLGECRGVVQITHGLAEYAERYERFARALRDRGYWVYANDQRGHGRSVDAERPLGQFGEPGFTGMWQDVIQFGGLVRRAHPDLPLILIGHSMGSMAAQNVIAEHTRLYAAVVLIGTTDLARFGELLGKLNATELGLAALNAGFTQRTGFEWLSRDTHEVDLYVADPLCGFETQPDTMAQFIGSAAHAYDPVALAQVNPDLSVLITSGSDDPINGEGAELLDSVADRLRTVAGLHDVTVKVYPGAHHEILNETNRDGVTADIIGWLDQHCG
jgi:alpha-beta hydrolase superfamily lysophospholipase